MSLTLKVTTERIEALPFEVYRKSGRDPDAQARFIAHFAVKDAEAGTYLDKDEALAELDKLSLGEVNEIARSLKETADEIAAPKA